MRLAIPTLILSSFYALSAVTLTTPVKSSSLVVYNAGIGLVHEERELKLSMGKHAITYPGVATTVQTDSVSVQLPKGIVLYSQQYRYDKITLHKIMEAHIGKPLRFMSGPEDSQVLTSGVLLATNPAVVKTQEGIIGGIEPGDFIFASIPGELIMQPSLVWNVHANTDINAKLELDYLISNIGWKADYTLHLGKNHGDITGWITVNNRSGKRFEAIKLNLLAGEINRATPKRHYAGAPMPERAMSAPSVTQQALEGYHFYSIPFNVTLADNEKTQVKFIDESHHMLTRLYDVRMQQPYSTATERKFPVNRYLELSPFEIPLPGGIVRTYAEVNGTAVLLGETTISNIPKQEKIKLRLGSDFDLIAKNTLIERSDDSKYYEATVEYSITNRSDEVKTIAVTVPDVINRAKHPVAITSSQHYRRPDGSSVIFDITLQPAETKIWRARYRAKK